MSQDLEIFIVFTLWLAFPVIDSFIHYDRIEIQGKYPVYSIAMVYRSFVCIVFMYLFNNIGYHWYWVAPMQLTTFWLVFNVSLNLQRGKPVEYLGREDDPGPDAPIETWMLKLLPWEFFWFSLNIILNGWTISALVFYGKMTFIEFLNTYVL